MDKYYNKVKNYLLDLEYSIILEDQSNATFVISKEEECVKNMIISISDPIVVVVQKLFSPKQDNLQMYKELLQKNNEIICGGFALDDKGDVVYRDTLQLENLDLNELEASINSLSILLGEYSDKILSFSK